MFGLEYIRKLNRDTSESLAKKLGVSKGTISMWENKKVTIPQKRIVDIALLYHVSEEYIGKDLTHLDELTLQKEQLEREVDDATIEVPMFDFNEKGEYVEVGSHFVCGATGAEDALRNIESDIDEEKLMQGIRDFIHKENADGFNSFEEYLDSKQSHIQILRVFLSLCQSKKTSDIFLMSVLRAIERSEDFADEWGKSNPIETDVSFTDRLCNVMRDHRRKEQERMKREYDEYVDLFGVPDDSENEE